MISIRAAVAAVFFAISSTHVTAQENSQARGVSPQDLAQWAAEIQRGYPAEALRNGEEGIVTMRIEVGADGRVQNCEVTRTSESEALDEAACRGMVEHARYDPARDAQGQSIASSTTQSVRYVYPKKDYVAPAFDHPVPVMESAWRKAAFDREYNAALREADAKYVVFQLVIDETGNLTGCGMNISTGDAALDRRGCAALLEHARFKPARLPNDDAIPGTYWIGHSPDAQR